MKKIKVKVSDFNSNDPQLARIKQRQLEKAQAFYAMHPYSTMVYMAMYTKLPYAFISGNWKQITKAL